MTGLIDDSLPSSFRRSSIFAHSYVPRSQPKAPKVGRRFLVPEIPRTLEQPAAKRCLPSIGLPTRDIAGHGRQHLLANIACIAILPAIASQQPKNQRLVQRQNSNHAVSSRPFPKRTTRLAGVSGEDGMQILFWDKSRPRGDLTQCQVQARRFGTWAYKTADDEARQTCGKRRAAARRDV